ncbi:MAG: hypothetical protein ACI8RD_009527 [Bacillariaceae sp.]|jgi:hypothetical protein
MYIYISYIYYHFKLTPEKDVGDLAQLQDYNMTANKNKNRLYDIIITSNNTYYCSNQSIFIVRLDFNIL